MRFEWILLLAAVGCSSSGPSGSGGYTIGRAPQAFSAAYLWSGSGDSNSVVALDEKNHELQEFTLKPFAHTRSLPIPIAAAQPGVVAGPNGGYYVITSEQDFAVMKPDGSFQTDIEQIPDGVTNVAFSPQANTLVLADDFHSMLLMELNATGDVTGHLRKGSLFPDGKNVTAGAMLADGRLALILDTNTLALVRTHDTIQQGDWAFDAHDVPSAGVIDWVAAVPNAPDMLLCSDRNRIFSLNAATGQVVDQLDLSQAEVIGRFRDYSPHVLVKDPAGDGVTDIYVVGNDGKILKHTLHGSAQNVTETLYDGAAQVLTVVYEQQQVYRFRLTDNLAMDVSKIEADANIVITPDFLFSLYKSALGAAAVQTYGTMPKVQRLTGYNLDDLIKRHQD